MRAAARDPAGRRLVSEAAEAGEKRLPLSGRELAVRLSYFLWSGPPDEALYQAAENGTLKNSGELSKQVDRMLADPKAESFFQAFLSQWFDLHRFDDIAKCDLGGPPQQGVAPARPSLAFHETCFSQALKDLFKVTRRNILPFADHP